MKFIYFAGSSFISAIIVALTLGANAINYILGLLNDKNLLHADSTENAVSTLTKLYTENNLVMIQQLFKNIFIIVLIVGCVLYFIVLSLRESVLKKINFLNSFIDIIEEYKSKKTDIQEKS